LLLQAVIALAIVRGALRVFSFRVIARALGLREGRAAEIVDAATVERAERIGWVIRVAAAHVPWNTTCLMEALAAAGLLRVRGIGGTLSLGVAKGASPDDNLLAHAWLQCGDRVLTGESERDRFAELTSFALD
jgi:hypothetical protein